MPPSQRLAHGRLNKLGGVSAGWPDLFIAEPSRRGSHGLFIEFKFGTNTLMPAQRELALQLQAKGYDHFVVYSLDGFQMIIRNYFGVAAPKPEVDDDDVIYLSD